MMDMRSEYMSIKGVSVYESKYEWEYERDRYKYKYKYMRESDHEWMRVNEYKGE